MVEVPLKVFIRRSGCIRFAGRISVTPENGQFKGQESYNELMHAFSFLLTSLFCLATPHQGGIGDIQPVSKFSGSGIVEEIQPGEIVIRRADGKRRAFLIQNKGERYLSLDGDEYIVAMPAKIRVSGRMPGELLERGMIVQFEADVNQSGKTAAPVKELKVIAGDEDSLKIDPETHPKGKTFVPCEFVGIIQRYTNHNMYMVVPKSRLAPRRRINVPVAEDAFFDIKADDLDRVRSGDKVVSFAGVKMSNGAMVILDIEIEMTAKREVATPSFSQQLFQKYSKLSDEPGEARQEVSEHFILHTDVSPRSAKVLLEKLETMYDFLARYYRKKPRQAIECYVVSDPDHFRGKIPARGVALIEAKAGLTASQPWVRMRGDRIKAKRTVSIVYSCDDHNVVQHEAVHAYCNMAFGTSGPIWYSEGMAEIGNYWAPEQSAIRIEPAVIAYLTTAEKKEMADIVAAGQITGDSWKAYAWRWALCHLLFTNPNYSKRFRELGINLMMEKDDSFEKAFGEMKERIAFEYDQFVANFDNGYRADLCVWQWVDEPQPIAKLGKVTVNARQGWQASSLALKQGEYYDFVCPKIKTEDGRQVQQTWKINDLQKPVTAQGNPRGEGKLMGVILSGNQLGEPFDIGAKKVGFQVPVSGHLYLRCKDKWNSLADNEGQISVYVRKTPGK